MLEKFQRSRLMVRTLGEYDVKVLGDRGAINVAGAILQPQHGSNRVYATSVHALPQIRSRSDDTKIRISSVASGLSKLERLSPLYRNIWNSRTSGSRSFDLLGASEEDALRRSLHPLEIDKDMDAVLRTVSSKGAGGSKKPRVMAIGTKSSGKSTFNRLLCNYFHTWTQGKKILYLDLDPGQPEFGPPGQVSLVELAAPILGPPFTHHASTQSEDFRLRRSHTIAATHFKDDPEHYQACVADLIKHADRSGPMIVNSCGWVTGTGADVLIYLVSMLKITDIILLEPLEESLAMLLKDESPDTEFHRIPRRAVRPPSRTPTDARAMQTMSYFHHRFGGTTSACRWSGRSINKIRPWVVSYTGENAGVSAIMSYGPIPSPNFLAEVLNGSLVAITTLDIDTISPFLECVNDAALEASAPRLEDFVQRTAEDIPYISPNEEGINYKLNPQTSQCVGLALIRGIDTERKEFHLITPLSESQIADLQGKQVTLVRGSFDPPEWAYLEDLVKGDDHGPNPCDEGERPWVSEKEMAGIESSVWRLRHPPVPSAAANPR